MEFNLVEDLFRVDSPYLQEFIETEMWQGPSQEQREDSLVSRADHMKGALLATYKHFSVVNKP